jgi:beta-lactamase superfamily II metal-dependent hydrolase
MNAGKINRKYGKLLLVLIGFVCIVLCGQTKVYAADTEMTIYGIYLGTELKGDSVLLESRGEYLLMDIGQEPSASYVIKELQKVGVTHLSLYFSHLHMDHVGGLSAYDITGGMQQIEAAGIQIDRLYLPDSSLAPRSQKYSIKYSVIQSYVAGRFPITYLRVGDTIQVGDASGQIIGPVNEYTYSTADNTTYENNCSLVAIFTCGNTRYFTAGDCTTEGAANLVSRYGNTLKCDIMKLNHHGTSGGNTRELLAAIAPTYCFAENSSYTGKDEETGRWQTYAALKRASEYGVCYMVANEKKTVIYRVINDQIQMYQGYTPETGRELRGWVRLSGGDGLTQSYSMYYINKNYEVLTGIQQLGSYYYNFGTGGCMVTGKYSSSGSYTAWRTTTEGKRCYVLSSDKKYARMQVGFSRVSGRLFYFDGEGYLLKPDPAIAENGFTEIGGRKYVMEANGHILTSQFVTVDGKDYYVNVNGNLLTSTMREIGGYNYIFDATGAVLYSPDEYTYVEYEGKKYLVDVDGSVVMSEMVKLDGEWYYFGKSGSKVKDKKVKIGKNYYYFGEDGVRVTDQKVRIDGKSYYFGSDGKAYLNKYVRLSNGKKYHCDKYGVMKLVKEKKED